MCIDYRSYFEYINSIPSSTCRPPASSRGGAIASLAQAALSQEKTSPSFTKPSTLAKFKPEQGRKNPLLNSFLLHDLYDRNVWKVLSEHAPIESHFLNNYTPLLKKLKLREHLPLDNLIQATNQYASDTVSKELFFSASPTLFAILEVFEENIRQNNPARVHNALSQMLRKAAFVEHFALLEKFLNLPRLASYRNWNFSILLPGFIRPHPSRSMETEPRLVWAQAFLDLPSTDLTCLKNTLSQAALADDLPMVELLLEKISSAGFQEECDFSNTLQCAVLGRARRTTEKLLFTPDLKARIRQREVILATIHRILSSPDLEEFQWYLRELVSAFPKASLGLRGLLLAKTLRVPPSFAPILQEIARSSPQSIHPCDRDVLREAIEQTGSPTQKFLLRKYLKQVEEALRDLQ